VAISPVEPTAAAQEVAAPAPSERKGQQWFELCLVLFISFGGSLYSGIHYLNQGPDPSVNTSVARTL